MRSITFNSSARVAVMEALSTTLDRAHSMLRWRFCAIDSMKLAAKFSIFVFIVWSVPPSPPPPPPPKATGWAAPMLVFGAMAAISAARVMKHPALPALAPSGATNTAVGTVEAYRLCTISLVDSSRPPGVSSWMTRQESPRRSATLIARAM